MAALLIAVGNLAFALSSVFVGLRLIRLWSRTRQLPELLLGVAIFVGGFVGHLLAWIVYVRKPAEPYLTLFSYTYRSAAALSCSLTATLAWYVFRRERGDMWARVLLGVIVLILVSYPFRDHIVGTGPPETLMLSPFYWMYTFGLTVPNLWCTVEALRYQSLIRRQWRIGLPADLVVAARMKFWAIGMGAMGSMLLSLDGLRLINFLRGTPLMDPRNVIGFLGLVSTISLCTAFFLPRAYVKRIQAAAAMPPAA
jgi:hypothetical protein